MVLTIIVWCGTTFLFGIVSYETVPLAQSLLFSAIWTVYALIVDNVLSFIFLYQLFKVRARVTKSARLNRLWKMAVGGLAVLCGSAWFSLLLILAATLAFPNQTNSRALLYRIAYAFSPFQFSGALVFIYTIQILFEKSDLGRDGEVPPTPTTDSFCSSCSRRHSILSATPDSPLDRSSSFSSTTILNAPPLGHVRSSTNGGKVGTGETSRSPSMIMIQRLGSTGSNSLHREPDTPATPIVIHGPLQ